MKQLNTNVSHGRGFTLIELMIVVAIIGILAAIAYPSYQDQVRATRRGDAQGALMAFANALERYHAERGTYLGADGGSSAITNTLTAPAATVFASEAPLDGGQKFYNLRLFNLTRNYYEIHAVAKGAQAGDGNLRLTSSGSRQYDPEADGSFQVAW